MGTTEPRPTPDHSGSTIYEPSEGDRACPEASSVSISSSFANSLAVDVEDDDVAQHGSE